MLLELIVPVVVLCAGYSLLINRVKGLPPGPPPLPLLGNGLSLGEPMDQVFLRWSKKYGPVFTVWMPGPVVVIADHQTLQDSIVKQGDLFGDRALPLQQQMMLAGGSYGLVFPANDMWKEQRRFALASLKDVGFLSASLQEAAKSYAQEIVADWKKAGADDEEVDVTENIMYGVANLIWQLTFGRTLALKDPLFMEIQEVVHRFFTGFAHPAVQFMNVLPSIVYLDPLFGYPLRNYRESFKDAMSFLENELATSEGTLNVDEEPRCYVDSFLIEMRRREEKGEPMGYFTRQQLAQAAMDLWFAGFETTASAYFTDFIVSTLRFGVHFLMSNQAAQSKMQAEIDEKIGQRARALHYFFCEYLCSRKQISLQDQRLLPYCCAVIHEVQRVGNIAEINFYRETTGEVTIAGHKIPGGTAILPQFPSVHIDPEHFERPDHFCPERHINEAGEFVKDPKITPFSIGKRACLGEGLARMELFIFLTTFVQHCTFSSISQTPPKLEVVRTINRAPAPYKVKITARF